MRAFGFTSWGPNGLFPREGQELPCEIASTRRGTQDPIDIVPPSTSFREFPSSEAGVPDDRGQDVVEVMGDTSREAPDTLHLLSLEELRFHLLALRYVLAIDDHRPDVGVVEQVRQRRFKGDV
jgi:hypothetical protein